MESDALRKLRHDLRGRWHALSMCIAVLEVSDDPEEQVEMLDLVAQSADEVEGVIMKIEALADHAI